MWNSIRDSNIFISANLIFRFFSLPDVLWNESEAQKTAKFPFFLLSSLSVHIERETEIHWTICQLDRNWKTQKNFMVVSVEKKSQECCCFLHRADVSARYKILKPRRKLLINYTEKLLKKPRSKMEVLLRRWLENCAFVTIFGEAKLIRWPQIVRLQTSSLSIDSLLELMEGI